MITIEYNPLHSKLNNLSSLQQQIYNALEKSTTRYAYPTIKELKFELKLREKIIHAAKRMFESDAVFSSFQDSSFNSTYWRKTSNGYLLKPNQLPSAAIEDVFINSNKYGFECVTSIVLIYYKAVLDSIHKNYFNELFRPLLVWNHHFDKDLGMITFSGYDSIPGDVVYFYNPDYETPIWMGENAVYLGEGQYFGHGIGIGTKEEMIEALNTLRKKEAKKSAYLLQQVTRLNFHYLSQFEK
jgi:protein-glutamine gamma-glutamyltransferase